MSYLALARKWRPQSFSELIGQEAIVTALRNAIRDDRIAQAYLFSGIRGVGKTTAARLLARALNESTEEPSRAANSPDLSDGQFDVIEVDAATYSKVEQVRELTESLRYRPTHHRFKVVILDEVHRLSRQAFDALLKIVEEPPSHVVFIFATTEIEAVPATLLSRCQEFHFRRVAVDVLTPHLRQICEQEEIAASETALRLIARAGEGSVRDSVALLDQLATFGQNAISDEEAVRLLGGLDLDLFYDLLEAISGGDADRVSKIALEVEDRGWDPRHTFSQFLGYLRDALHLALGDRDRIDLPSEEIVRLEALAGQIGYESLLRLLNQLLAAEPLLRRAEAALLALEIVWLRAAELPKLTALEELLSGRDPSSTPPPSRGGSPGVTSSGQTPSGKRSGSADPEAKTADDGLAQLKAFVAQRRDSLAVLLDDALGITLGGCELRISCASNDTLLADALARPGNRTILDEACRQVFGEQVSWSLERSKAPLRSSSPANGAEPTETPRARLEDDPLVAESVSVKTILDVLDGTVLEVSPRRPTSQ